jgi:hypothetical protein
MANTNTVFGARLFQSPYGGHVFGRAYIVDGATDATAMFVGDFVKLTGESKIWNDGIYYPVVTQAAATNNVIGFVTGFEAHPDYLSQIYRTASTTRLVWVMDDPSAEFEIQQNGTSAAGDEFTTVDVVVAAGDTNSGLSGMQLNRASGGDSKQIKILRLSPRANSGYGTYTKFICKVNPVAHQMLISTGV